MFNIFQSKLSSPVKASLAFTFASFLQQGINIITVPIFTRIMSESAYGQVSVYNAWFSVLNVIITLSLVGGVINNGLLDFGKDKKGFISSLLFLATISTLIFYIFFILFKNYILNFIQLPELLIHFMFINFILNTAIGIWGIEQRFEFKYISVIIINLLCALISPILAFIAVITFPNAQVEARIIGLAIVPIIINLAIYIKIMVEGKKFIALDYWRYALIFNIPLIPHYLSYIILAQSDRIMIAKFIGDDKAGIYSIAYSLSTVAMIIFNAINSSFIPWTYTKLKEKSYKDLEEKTNILVLVGAIWCFLFMIFAPEAISILAPPNYYEAIYIIPPVVMGVYFTFIYTFFANIEFYYKQTILVMIASVTTALLNITLNLIFIPKFGYIAAGYTTMIGYLMLCFIHYIFMKKIQKNRVYNINFIVIISTILISLSFIVLILYKYSLFRYLLIGIILIILILFNRSLKNLVRIVRNR